jgi:L-lactate dehydrogenase
VAIRHSGWGPARIVGSGTVLDSARFRYLLSRHCDVDARNVHAYILGEHGDSEVAAWSMTHVAGMHIDDYCTVCGKCGTAWREERRKIAEAVRDSAYHIINYKGATYYAIGLALVRIVGAVLRNEHSVLTVSTMLSGDYGLEDVCLSVPCIVSRNGVERVITAKLTDEESQALRRSANTLKETLAALETGGADD